MDTKITNINVSLLETNKGQIDGLPKNPRFIRDRRFEKLKQSITEAPEMLYLRELLVFPLKNKYVIIGGNMRYRACRDLGHEEIPCKILPTDTPIEKLREYSRKDNQEFGEDDLDLLANEWDPEELERWGFEIPTEWETGRGGGSTSREAKEDDFDPSQPVETVCKNGDIWMLGGHRLMCGDSTSQEDIARLMDGQKAALWVTDPPYNVDVSNIKGAKIMNDNMKSTDFEQFLTKSFRATKPVLEQGCPFYIWYASRTHIEFETAMNRAGFTVKQQLVWNKNQILLGRSHYQWKHELCLYGWKDDTCRYFTPLRNNSTVIRDAAELDIDKLSKQEMRDLLHEIYDQNKVPVTVIDEKKPNVCDMHQTMKPVRLIAYLIGNSSIEGEIVLDTFGGSGTTLVACEQLGRKCRMMELDPHYCDVIISRWEKFTGRKAEKMD